MISLPDHDQTLLPADVEPAPAPAPDMLAELGPLAYGLFALDQEGSLREVRSLQESRTGQVPAQAGRAAGRDDSRSEALLDELGELDL